VGQVRGPAFGRVGGRRGVGVGTHSGSGVPQTRDRVLARRNPKEVWIPMRTAFMLSLTLFNALLCSGVCSLSQEVRFGGFVTR
jgi:hypothetical protein